MLPDRSRVRVVGGQDRHPGEGDLEMVHDRIGIPPRHDRWLTGTTGLGIHWAGDADAHAADAVERSAKSLKPADFLSIGFLSSPDELVCQRALKC